MSVAESLSFFAGNLSTATNTTTTKISASTVASGTSSGALVVTGGAGIGGDLYTGGTSYAGLFQSTSDLRLKTDINTLTNALDLVQQLRGVDYRWRSNGELGIGLVAQEVQAVVPCAVVSNGEYLTVSYANLVGLLVEAIKEQQQQIEQLKKRFE